MERIWFCSNRVGGDSLVLATSVLHILNPDLIQAHKRRAQKDNLSRKKIWWELLVTSVLHILPVVDKHTSAKHKEDDNVARKTHLPLTRMGKEF